MWMHRCSLIYSSCVLLDLRCNILSPRVGYSWWWGSLVTVPTGSKAKHLFVGQPYHKKFIVIIIIIIIIIIFFFDFSGFLYSRDHTETFLKMVTCSLFAVIITYLCKVYETQNLGNTVVKVLSELSDFSYYGKTLFASHQLKFLWKKRGYLVFTNIWFFNKELIIATLNLSRVIPSIDRLLF